MRAGKLYRTYFKNNLFMKMILLFAVITIATIVTFSYIMFDVMSGSIVRNELDNQKKAMEGVSAYLNQKYLAVQSYVLDVYRDPSLQTNISYFFSHPFEDYVKNRLDQYVETGGTGSPKGLEYFENKMDDDPDIANLILYSTDKQHLYVFKKHNVSKLIASNAAQSYIPDAMAMTMENGNVSVPNLWVRKAIEQGDPKLYSVRSPVNDKTTLKNIGLLLVYYQSEGIERALASYRSEMKGYIVVLSPDGQVIFDSSNRYYGKPYPYMDRIDTLHETAMLEEESYVTNLTQTQAGYTVVGVAPVREVAAAYEGLKRTILLISAICIVVALVIPTVFVMNFAKRTNKIIRFMRKVETGDLGARIQDEREDELGQISRSFNEMLDELTKYIDSVYKAEIKQKHTELAALQARVNPHFLYNTLEVIRMRAMSQGAKDVGEMIYSLSVLFKSYVQPKTVHTIKDELENSRLYLELFRIRYKDRFAYEICCDEELKDRELPRMTLQPLIENYIVHGLKGRRDDHFIAVAVTREDGHIRIVVKDNGSGIPPHKLEEIRRTLQLPEEAGESFGLRSVHERLRLLYGSEYGIEVDSEQGAWTTVTVTLPDTKEGQGSDV
ncbi:sensor histidine kinase [Paenibacillus sp. N4]|uniref:sensor histidine kinase n=1 Tax=Paenibacillus vietnamensis TaxID=2590547 RepID=UPI001CD090A0|nr:sensor histidine kinase [Paenibacillus vietnamensis]MCA0753604.1 sensor histidine kinase [Paenibacillus vietnamensis]